MTMARRRTCGASLLIRLLFVSLTPLLDALTVTTFNLLAPVHRSLPQWEGSPRESTHSAWWKPRTKSLAQLIRRDLSNSDIILLQEWWFRPEFQDLFDSITGTQFTRVAERRPDREDGLAVLVNRRGRLQLQDSQCITTCRESQRIGQIVTCRDVNGRQVNIGNVHLSFPSHEVPHVNAQRQAAELQALVDGLAHAKSPNHPPHLELIAGDFNSHSRALPARWLEREEGFVSCMSAAAAQALSDKGGRVNLGVTHRTHLGEHVSVDHVFGRLVASSSRRNCASSLRLGYLDADGTRIVDCHKRSDLLSLEAGATALVSDHVPVTATLEWPSVPETKDNYDNNPVMRRADVHLPLDPLEPPSYLGNQTMLLSR